MYNSVDGWNVVILFPPVRERERFASPRASLGD